MALAGVAGCPSWLGKASVLPPKYGMGFRAMFPDGLPVVVDGTAHGAVWAGSVAVITWAHPTMIPMASYQGWPVS